jgi:hypothetical protein
MRPNSRGYILIRSLLRLGPVTAERGQSSVTAMGDLLADKPPAPSPVSAVSKYADDSMLSIVLTLYVQMVTYIQELRARVERIVVGGSGLIILLDGWLVTTSHSVTVPGKVVVSVGIALFTCVLALVIRTRHRQFRGYAQIIRKINEVQLVYTPGVFLQDQILYPEGWKNFGSATWKEPIFAIAYPIQLVVGLFGIVAIWFV